MGHKSPASRINDRGAALVYVLITLALAGILASGLMMMIVSRVRSQSVDIAKAEEYYLADGVVELLRAGKADQIDEFLGLSLDRVHASIPAEINEDSIVREVYYNLRADNACTVIYYGDAYRTEITCVWYPLPGSVTAPEYTFTQTARVFADAPEGGDVS